MKESNERSETSEQPNNPTNAKPSDSTLEAFRAALLAEEKGESQEGERDESQPSAEPPAGEPTGDKPKGKPKSLKDVAERLGLSDADLYAIEVPMADGKTLSIGKLKDAAAKQEDLEVRETQFAERVSKQEAEWTRSQTEFAELMKLIDPKAIKPELQEKVRAKVEADRARERKLVLDTIPEWSDTTVREAELGAMVEFLKDFGIHESFLSATMNHKLFRMVRYATLQKQRVDRALAKVEKLRKPSTTGKGAPQGTPPKRPSTPSRKGSRPTDLRSQFANTLREAG